LRLSFAAASSRSTSRPVRCNRSLPALDGGYRRISPSVFPVCRLFIILSRIPYSQSP
jgi:hypothetical protein